MSYAKHGLLNAMLKELRRGHVAYDLMPSSIMLACGSKFVQQSTSQSACHFCYRSRRCLAEWVSQGLVLLVKGSSNRCLIYANGLNLEILLNPKKFSAISWSMVEKCFDSKTVLVASSSFGSTLRMGQQNCGCGPCEKDIRHSIQKAMVILLS